jgi:hypothetical protein
VVAEQQYAAALELEPLVQIAHAREHRLGRGRNVIEIGERRRHVRRQRTHPLDVSVAQRRALGQRAEVRFEAPDLAQRHARAAETSTPPASSRATARIDRRGVQQRLQAQRRTVIRLLMVNRLLP